MSTFNPSHLKNRFKDHQYITKADLLQYFSEFNIPVNDSTLRWRIHQLKAANVLRSIKRGIYTFSGASDKPKFNPSASENINTLFDIYSSNFKPGPCIIWSTEWLVQFMELLPVHHFIVVEIEKELTHALFLQINQAKHHAYLNPDRRMMTDYVISKKNPVIIRSRPRRAPIQINDQGVPMPTLEKILVDVFCDKDIFISHQDRELKNIFNNAWKNYQLNLSSLINYAQRRHRAEPLTEFIKQSAPDFYRALTQVASLPLTSEQAETLDHQGQ